MVRSWSWPLHEDALECLEGSLHVVGVSSCHSGGEWSASVFCQDIPLGTEPASISGIMTCLFPQRGALTELESRDCHLHLMPLTSWYLPRSLTHTFWKTPSLTHCWNLLRAVEPEPYPFGRAFHWHPVRSTPSMTFLKGRVGLPSVPCLFSCPSIGAVCSHMSSGMRLMIPSCLVIFFTPGVKRTEAICDLNQGRLAIKSFLG